MDAVAVDVLVLNYNGRALLAECLPSIVRAAAASKNACRVVVVDNDSSDDSLSWLAAHFPTVALRRCTNRGLCSFNDVLAESTAAVCLLLNNDVQADERAFDPLIEAVLSPTKSDAQPVFMAAPRCFLFDGRSHEGFRTAVRRRYGLVQATAHFEGAEAIAHVPGETASSGAVLAVNRAIFLELGGFDDRYLPGRIEDLDFCFRGFLSGRRACYVPESVFYHRGGATFDDCFGRAGSERLAMRNTLLFQWKNLRHPQQRRSEAFWLPIRMLRDVVAAPFASAERRFAFLHAYCEARRLHATQGKPPSHGGNLAREEEFFGRYAPAQLLADARPENKIRPSWREIEASRDANYPISRWYLRPVALACAEQLGRLGVRPSHVTILGLFIALAAGLLLLNRPEWHIAAAGLILASWLCDRIDGPLARRQGSASAWGAWLDANVDEGVDLGLHAATAAAAAQLTGSTWPWTFLIAFLFGKYLLMHGLASDDEHSGRVAPSLPSQASSPSLLRSLYHLPGNADVRLHLLAVAVVCGRMTWELAFVAAYYNFRWIARYALMAKRFRAASTAGVAA